MKPESLPLRDPGNDRFRDLFERYYEAVNCYFVHLGFSPEESRDLAQDTFLRAYRGLGGFRGAARFRTWLFTIARNVGSNAIRAQETMKRGGREVILDDLQTEAHPGSVDSEVESPEDRGESVPSSAKPSPLEGLLSEEQSRLLREALDSLPPRMRRSVFLRYGQDLKYREIADLLQVSIDTVKSQLHQARQRLAPILSAQPSKREPHLP